MRDAIFCKYFRSMMEHDTCEAGITYELLKGIPFDKRPCFCRNGVAPGGCDKAAFPTAEEIAAEDAEIDALFARTTTARASIVAHLGGHWKEGTPGASGAIDCPICKSVKSLHFSRAEYNGHIHARCETENCVSWME